MELFIRIHRLVDRKCIGIYTYVMSSSSIHPHFFVFSTKLHLEMIIKRFMFCALLERLSCLYWPEHFVTWYSFAFDNPWTDILPCYNSSCQHLHFYTWCSLFKESHNFFIHNSTLYIIYWPTYRDRSFCIRNLNASIHQLHPISL